LRAGKLYENARAVAECRRGFDAGAPRAAKVQYDSELFAGGRMDYLTRRHNLGDLLRRSAARVASKPAVVCGDIRWSYAEFDRIADAVAAGLKLLGIAKGTRVAVLARNSHAFAAMRFAVARLGAVLVPVNYMLKA
jgi:acyl-CoA synthetase (AMP-forming)/AMP-acid ligase II